MSDSKDLFGVTDERYTQLREETARDTFIDTLAAVKALPDQNERDCMLFHIGYIAGRSLV